MLETIKESPFFSKGLHFSCVRCSACCRYDKGYVFLSKKDANQLEAALKMNHEEFCAVYCRWIPSENGEERLSLKEKTNYDCILWNENGCSVYETRPFQCSTFPFWNSALASRESWEATAENCPGIGSGSFFSQEFIEKTLNKRNNESIISRAAQKRGEF